MERIDVKNYNIGFLNISRSTQRPDGCNSKILYNNKDFKVQTPLCIVKEIDLKCDKPFIKVSFKISSNFNYFQFFSNINELCIEKLTKTWDLDEDEVRHKFLPTTEKNKDSEMIIKIKVNKSTIYFNNKKQEIHGLEIKKEDKIVCMLKTNGLISDSDSASQVWIALQCLKYN